MADNGYPDRSKQRRPGILSPILKTAKTAMSYADSTKEAVAAVQTGTLGKFKWSTNLLDMLGSNLYSSIQGKQSIGGIGKSALEKSLFGFEFDIDKDKSVGFETGPAEMGRDYRLTFTKKF